MKTRQVKIINEKGMHARAAAKLVQLSHQFSSSITLEKNGEQADAKSITDILMLSGAKDSVLTVSVEGSDEDRAIMEIEALFNDGFGEEE